MKIGILSDTHLREPHPEFKRIIDTHLKEVDQIFHAGDFVDRSIVEYLSGLKELTAVCGNMDPPDIQRALPSRRVIGLGRFRIGLIHGSGSPIGIESRVREEFGEIDAIIYGHTHLPANHRIKDTFFFNPGSLTRSPIHKPTLGILHIGEQIEGEMVYI